MKELTELELRSPHPHTTYIYLNYSFNVTFRLSFENIEEHIPKREKLLIFGLPLHLQKEMIGEVEQLLIVDK